MQRHNLVFASRRLLIRVLVAVGVSVGMLAVTFTSTTASANPSSSKLVTSTNPNPICSRLGTKIMGSSGMRMWCFGPQPNGAKPRAIAATAANPTYGANVDAASPQEDVSPSGVQAYGQAEVSVASVDKYVVEAWNDSTGFFSPCPSSGFKEELTGYAISGNGGRSFTDEGGVPNANCNAFRNDGDPTVEAWHTTVGDYFYIGSLYPSFTGLGPNYLAMDACKAVTLSNGNSTIQCGQPIAIAVSSQCVTSGGFTFCSFLDKEFMSIDPARGRLYVSYTEFGVSGPLVNGQIELAVCDIGTRTGGTGSLGGTPGHPVCENGGPAAPSPTATPAPPYLTVQPADANCEHEGAYPAVDLARGDVYVAWEYNWASNLFNPACFNTPTQERLAYVPFACLTLTPTSPCATMPEQTAVNIVAMDANFIPGYNRFPANSFPRIAVSDPYGTVSIVWNDARFHPMGDILLQSFHLITLFKVQTNPVRVNSQSAGGMHFLPAMRQADQDGRLSITFYQRPNASTDDTFLYGSFNLAPTITSPPSSNVNITTGGTPWLDTSSDIIPNFGDYTDNYIHALNGPPWNGELFYVAWSDGRVGMPQPFEDATVTD